VICETACRSIFPNDPQSSRDELRSSIDRILKNSGAPSDVAEPSKNELNKCGSREYWRILAWAASVTVLSVIAVGLLLEVVAFAYPELPVRYWPTLYRAVFQPTIDCDVNALANEVATSICKGELSTVRQLHRDDRRYRMRVIVGDQSDDRIVYARISAKPEKCDRVIKCEFVFRGVFDPEKYFTGQEIAVLGEFSDISSTGNLAYITFERCKIGAAD
jgi:hypothetical protein